jgi:hypothetical protein
MRQARKLGVPEPDCGSHEGGNLSVTIDDARPRALIDTLTDPADGQRDRLGMENHDTVICAAPVRGKLDG